MANTWMLYGATGYTGKLTVPLAADRGMTPILAGRNASKLEAVAAPHGFQTRAFSLDDPAATRAALEDVDVVLHDAGPFTHTGAPMLDACLATGTHYLDITGELSVFEATFARDADALAAGVTILSGAGLDVVPSDCLAATLAAQMPDATELDLAMWSRGSPSAGTAKSVMEILANGGFERRNGKMESVPPLARTRDVQFHGKVREVAQFPLGDLITCWHGTRIPTIRTWVALRPSTRRVARVARHAMRIKPARRLVQRIIHATVDGPENTEGHHVQFHAEVRNASGDVLSGVIVTPGGYSFTADCTLRAVQRLLDGGVPTGAQSPSGAFGADFAETCDGVTVHLQGSP